MLNLDFNYIAATNFLCFGSEGIELDLTQYSRIVLIKGENRDRHIKEGADEQERAKSRNGVGKSSIPEIIVYTLTGRTIKPIRSQDSVINNKNKKGLRTEVRWGRYRVVRTRKPNSLRVWESENHVWDDDSEITLGGIPATQELIDKIIVVSHPTLTNLLAFTDKNSGGFLESDIPTKRMMVENLLSLDSYREYFERAKKLRNKHNEKIKTAADFYMVMLRDLDHAKSRVVQAVNQEASWLTARKGELTVLIGRIRDKQKKLEQTDGGAALVAYNAAQEEIKQLNETLSPLQENIEKIKSISADIQKKMSAVRQKTNALDRKSVV